MATAVFAEHQVLPDIPDIFRSHDFVSGTILQHTVLMNAGFVSKRILARQSLCSAELSCR
jgi:hypothetical protein